MSETYTVEEKKSALDELRDKLADGEARLAKQAGKPAIKDWYKKGDNRRAGWCDGCALSKLLSTSTAKEKAKLIQEAKRAGLQVSGQKITV